MDLWPSSTLAQPWLCSTKWCQVVGTSHNLCWPRESLGEPSCKCVLTWSCCACPQAWLAECWHTLNDLLPSVWPAWHGPIYECTRSCTTREQGSRERGHNPVLTRSCWQRDHKIMLLLAELFRIFLLGFDPITLCLFRLIDNLVKHRSRFAEY